VSRYRLAIALDPANWTPRDSLVYALVLTDGEEAAWRASKEFLHAVAAAPAGERPEKRHLTNAAGNVWDLPLALEATLADAKYYGGAGLNHDPDESFIADIYGLMHDSASAERYITASDPANLIARAETLLLQTYVALDRNDPAAAVAPMEAFWKAWQADTDLQVAAFDNQCFLGLAYGLSGRLADAEAFFRIAGPWNRCYAFHGDALAHAGDIEGARGRHRRR